MLQTYYVGYCIALNAFVIKINRLIVNVKTFPSIVMVNKNRDTKACCFFKGKQQRLGRKFPEFQCLFHFLVTTVNLLNCTYNYNNCESEMNTKKHKCFKVTRNTIERSRPHPYIDSTGRYKKWMWTSPCVGDQWHHPVSRPFNVTSFFASCSERPSGQWNSIAPPLPVTRST